MIKKLQLGVKIFDLNVLNGKDNGFAKKVPRGKVIVFFGTKGLLNGVRKYF
jgi:hypothetical protein